MPDAPAPAPAAPDRADSSASFFTRAFSGAASDLRHAFRQLWKRPGFASITLLTLALCIGANTAIFSAVYSLLLKPLPFPQPDRLVEIYNTYPKGGGGRGSSNLTQYLDYRDNTTSYAKVGLWSSFEGMFGEDASAERLSGLRVTADLFDVLGLKPIIGQFFTTENHLPAADKVLVLTQSFWETHYSEDPGVLGKTVRLDGETFTIIGVAPRALEAFNAARARFVRPMSWDPKGGIGNRHGNSPNLFARLKPGVPVAQAQAEAEAVEQRFNDAAAPQLRAFIERSGHKIVVINAQVERVKPLRTTLLLLQGGVALVLLIGCVNVANLLLTRANGRQSELAIRFALGASRGVIARQLLLESLLLTTFGTALGVGLAAMLTYFFNLYRARMMPDALPFALDGQVLGVTLALSLGSALLISIAPIFHILRANLMQLIHRTSRGSSVAAGVRRLSGILIVSQVAIAVMLLSVAGLLMHSFIKALAVDPGFDPHGVVSGRIAIPLAHRKTDETSRALHDRVLQAMREIPGVSSAALSIATPFRGGLPLNAFTLAEDTLPPGSPQPGASRVVVSPEYFDTLRLKLLEGSFLPPGDSPTNRNTFVVDENFAKRYFPGRSAIGGRLIFGGPPQGNAPWPTVVGVVRHVPHRGVHRIGMPDVADPAVAQRPNVGQLEQVRRGGGRQRQPCHAGTKPRQPQRKPCALETGVAGQQHAFAAPEGRAWRTHHFFHGARPDCHRSSSRFFSRSVSMGCQKPACIQATSSPSRAKPASGSASQLVASPAMRSMTSGDNTKKPPLIRPPSPRGFSVKPRTAPASSCKAPYRPGGATAVMVASFPWALWNATDAAMSMSDRPSP